MSLSRPRLGLAVFASGAALVAATRWALGRRFRCAALRRHRWGWVRGLHTVWAVHSFARRLELACRALPAPVDATAALDGGGRVLAAVLAEGKCGVVRGVAVPGNHYLEVKYEDGTVNDNLSRPGHPEGCVCVRPLQWIKPAWHSRSRGEL